MVVPGGRETLPKAVELGVNITEEQFEETTPEPKPG